MYGRMTQYEGANKITNFLYEDGKVKSKKQVHKAHAFYSRDGKPIQALKDDWWKHSK